LSDRIFRPTLAHIDLNTVKENYINIKNITGNAVMPVIKANAYGHGAVECAKILSPVNADIFGVATIEEGIELRENGIDTPILILGSIYPMENFRAVIEYGLTPTIASHYSAVHLEKTAREMDKKVSFHLKVDSGMGRIGVSLDTAVDVWNEFSSTEYLEGEGVFTHFSSADEDPGVTAKQIKYFEVYSCCKYCGHNEY
jgi:alanine racemase